MFTFAVLAMTAVQMTAQSEWKVLIGTEEFADVRSKMEDVRSDIFNLNGQRVANSFRGLVIKNGHTLIQK